MDERLFRWVNDLADRTTWLHGIAVAYADYGIALFAMLLLWAWWIARKTEQPVTAVAAVSWAGVAALVGALAVQLIGSPINRARPTAVLPGTHLLLERTSDFSFPSDHATATAAVAFGLVVAGSQLNNRWIGRTAVGLAVLMCVDRVYVGAHYPTDVLAGFVLGAAVAVLLARPATALLSKLTLALSNTPLRPLIVAKSG